MLRTTRRKFITNTVKVAGLGAVLYGGLRFRRFLKKRKMDRGFIAGQEIFIEKGVKPIEAENLATVFEFAAGIDKKLKDWYSTHKSTIAVVIDIEKMLSDASTIPPKHRKQWEQDLKKHKAKTLIGGDEERIIVIDNDALKNSAMAFNVVTRQLYTLQMAGEARKKGILTDQIYYEIIPKIAEKKTQTLFKIYEIALAETLKKNPENKMYQEMYRDLEAIRKNRKPVGGTPWI
ncbi:MAG: hypothetical protein QT03_C0001G1045 [archaeon GW2011_AR10]|uniref:Uncharacterized protein n=1 Tax=Candidatus Iainarchaeum sp. TaxID=3101447 RepID=A0A7J4IQV8_9ARCH|nr:MAG: hypothetical protein QT03_C0001G1045 [archaeon GW2011_AR10]HIH07812.1 hypothetical protein [Candidatus Diapherotrites archaeon]